MKLKLLAATAALLLTQTTMAAEMTSPFSCPSVDTLKNIGITDVTSDHGEWLGVILNDKLGTTINWSFFVGPFEKSPRNEMLAKANIALLSLELSGAPNEGPVGTWECKYDSKISSKKLQAIAITPPLAIDTAQFARLKR